MREVPGGVWIFQNLLSGRFAGGAFSSRAEAERWIEKHALSGVLTLYPVHVGVYEWAIEKGLFTPKKPHESEAAFIGSFTTAVSLITTTRTGAWRHSSGLRQYCAMHPETGALRWSRTVSFVRYPEARPWRPPCVLDPGAGFEPRMFLMDSEFLYQLRYPWAVHRV